MPCPETCLGLRWERPRYNASTKILWHVPISDAERAYKQEHGADALIDRLEAVEPPWVFDEYNRPSLLE